MTQSSSQSLPKEDLAEKIPKELQITYNLPELFYYILLSQLGQKKLYFGMAEYSDNPVELWYSRAWGSSLVTISGKITPTT
ncbi:hypothetical protein BO71DRAFT_142864 [Aspergillus ellipticus CBS 707.79]|uniref:Uncharacterized protein n=1 Tax=Aspergillus ellipticus CBS 707.79 TaxID=1448320 RepID=A0A319DIS4_9EURO|nr:hypothetical protein BO71DRAFT_142864 [Aspergillus ellipticus CBS 707.79]